MALSVQTNVSSLNAQSNVEKSQGQLNTAMSRLSSGLRINNARDDAAGLSISSKLSAEVRSLGQAQRNANDGISMLQTAEGALNEVNGMLQRMRELAVQSANGTLGSSERQSLNDEFSALKSEIDRITSVTEFNGTTLLDGTLSSGVTFQVGSDNTDNDRITVSVADSDATALGIATSVGISSLSGARNALSVIDTAIARVSDRRGDLGAAQNRLFTTINNLASTKENLVAANSRIQDADVATEAAALSASNIRLQAGVAVLAQANQQPALALSLIG